MATADIGQTVAGADPGRVRRLAAAVSRRLSAPALLGLACLLLYAAFYGGAAWNQNARLDGIFALVEPGTRDSGTFHIDRFILSPVFNTGDWAWHDGHFYPNKAPGTTFLGGAFYLVLSRIETGLLGWDLQAVRLSLANAYLIHLFVSVLWAALGMVAFHALAARLSGNPELGLGLACVLAFGTIAFPFSTVLMGHVTALGWVCLGLYLVDDRRTGWRPDHLFLAGLCFGFAVLTEYICAITVALVLPVVLWRHRWQARRFVLGGAPAVLLHAVYHTVCFGNPLTTATAFSNPAVLIGQSAGLFGHFAWDHVGELLFGPYRGTFVYMPVLLLTGPGLILWWQREPRSPWAWLCAGNLVLYVLVVASFGGWYGGACAGPRYLIASLPFWVLPLGEVWRQRGGWRVALGALLAVSVANMLVIAAVSATVPEEWQSPLPELYRRFLQGRFSPWFLPVKLDIELTPGQRRLMAFNWGQLLGLRGLWSLAPILAGVGLLLAAARRRLPAGVRRPSAD